MLSEFERLLQEPGCPACGHVAEGERAVFSWFQIESFMNAERRLVFAPGWDMCPAHVRRLVDEVGEGHVMTVVAREALSGARQILQGEGDPGPCPACEATARASGHACRLLVDGLQEPANARLYDEHSGMCLPHVAHAATTADASTLALLAERLLTSLREQPDASLESVAGIDQDAARRAKWRERLRGGPTSESTVAELTGRLADPACPVCRNRGLIERGYVQWFGDRSRENDPSIGTDPGELCSTHLHDVSVADQAAAAGAIRRQRARRAVELQRLLSNLGQLRSTVRRGKRRGPDELDRARHEFTTDHHCPACYACTGVERSQLELVTASLALAPLRARYEHSHGLCVRHAVQVRAGDTSQVIRRHATARVGLLAWEVQEIGRKYGWAYRHEAPGPERDAWLSALGQIDGRVFEGAPAAASGDTEPRKLA